MFRKIIWDLSGKFAIQIVSFITSIVLTRLLTPTEYGIMGMAMVVIAFSHVFLDLGFNRAIIQRPEVSQTQYSTIFWVNLGMAFLLMIACFLGAGTAARFYRQPVIKPIFQIASLSFLINGLNLVPSSMLYKKMHFKVNSIQSLIAVVISGVIGIGMAYSGYGVWALLTQSLVGSFILLVLNWIYVKWWPSFRFSIVAIKPMWNYGSRLFASGVLDTLFSRLDSFIIAKIFSPATLGYYARAQGVDNMVKQFSAGSIVGTLFPYIAEHQHNRKTLSDIYRKYLNIILFISVGMSGGLFLVANDLFTVLFTAKWLSAAKLFQLLALMGFAYPVSSLMCAIISGVGNSKAFFRLELIKKGFLLPVYIFGFILGLKYFILFMGVAFYIAVIINAYYVTKEIPVTINEQLITVLQYSGFGAVVCAFLYFLKPYYNGFSPFINVVISGTAFAIIYTVGIRLMGLSGGEILKTSFQKIRRAFQ